MLIGPAAGQDFKKLPPEGKKIDPCTRATLESRVEDIQAGSISLRKTVMIRRHGGRM